MKIPPMKTSPRLLALLKQAAEDMKRMSPDEQKKMIDAQRESWVRGEMELAKDPRFN